MAVQEWRRSHARGDLSCHPKRHFAIFGHFGITRSNVLTALPSFTFSPGGPPLSPQEMQSFHTVLDHAVCSLKTKGQMTRVEKKCSGHPDSGRGAGLVWRQELHKLRTRGARLVLFFPFI